MDDLAQYFAEANRERWNFTIVSNQLSPNGGYYPMGTAEFPMAQYTVPDLTTFRHLRPHSILTIGRIARKDGRLKAVIFVRNLSICTLRQATLLVDYCLQSLERG